MLKLVEAGWFLNVVLTSVVALINACVSMALALHGSSCTLAFQKLKRFGVNKGDFSFGLLSKQALTQMILGKRRLRSASD